MNYVMGWTKSHGKTHIAPDRDIERALCGAVLVGHIRRMDDESLVPYAPHWGNDSMQRDQMCEHCERRVP